MIVVSVSVVTDNPEHATRSAEAFARAATGLALDGVSVALSMGTVEHDEDTTP